MSTHYKVTLCIVYNCVHTAIHRVSQSVAWNKYHYIATPTIDVSTIEVPTIAVSTIEVSTIAVSSRYYLI